MVKATKSHKINKLLYFFALSFLLIAAPFGCTGLGISGGSGLGNFFSPLNQESGEKNTGGDQNDSGDETEDTDGNVASTGSPDQPKQDGIGKPAPPGGTYGDRPLNPGGTVAANPSPGQPTEEGIGKCGMLQYKVQGKVRPPALPNAECVEFSTAPVVTTLWKDPLDGQWKPRSHSLPIVVDACGNFETTISFVCVDPHPIKIKAVFGYQGVMYETVSEEIHFLPILHPGQTLPPDPPVLEAAPEVDEDPIDRYPRYRPHLWNEGLPNGTFNP